MQEWTQLSYGNDGNSHLLPRHAGHRHTINIKYGYIVLLLSAFTLASITILNRIRKLSCSRPSFTKNGAFSVFYVTLFSWVTMVLIITLYGIHLPEQYSTMVKRLGRICYALIPLDLALAIRPNWLAPDYLQFVDLHKWLSRLTVVSGILHGIGYLAKFIWGGRLTEVFQFQNFLGLLIFFSFCVLGVISLKIFREKSYRWFYLVHQITMTLFLVLILFHARPGVTLLFLFAVTLLVMHGSALFFACRNNKYKLWHAVGPPEVIAPENASLGVIRISRESFPYWIGGAHLRLSCHNGSPWKNVLYPSHPFTIASITEDDSIDLIIKNFSHFSWNDGCILLGPYPSLDLAFYVSPKDSIIVCGGSGISYGLPVYRSMAQNGSNVRLIWCTRNKEDLFVLRTVQFSGKAEVYLTGGAFKPANLDEEADGILSSSNYEDVPMSSLLSSSEDKVENESQENFVRVTEGRPNFALVLKDFSEETRPLDKCVIACGPEDLVDLTSKLCQIHRIAFVGEKYAL